MSQRFSIHTLVSIFIYISLFIASYITAIYVIKIQPANPSMFQAYLEPAVMVTCGKGFTTSNETAGKKLKDFLVIKTYQFSCNDLPSHLTLNQDMYIRSWYYEIMAIALIWKVAGISWPVLNNLIAFIFALAVCAVFAICRLGMALPLAIMSACLYLFKSNALSHVMSLRDTARAPFMLWGIFILILLVIRPFKNRALLLLSVFLGILIGVGVGFRPDVITLLPPTVITLIFFLPGSFFKNFARNFLLLGIFITSFLLIAYPVYHTYSSENQASCMSHVTLLGLNDGFTATLGLEPSVYNWHYKYSDEMTYAMINAYATHFLHIPPFKACTRAYDTSANALLKSIVTNFPADMLARGYGSIYQLLQLQHSVILTIALLLCLVCVEWRLALFLLLALLYFGGYPAIQFAPRHYYYLTFWYCWPIGFFLTQAYYYGFTAAGLSRFKKFCQTMPIKFYLKRIGCFVIGIAFVTIVPLQVARVYQTKTVTHIINSYIQAPKQPIPYELVKHVTKPYSLYRFNWPDELQMAHHLIRTPGDNNIISKLLHIRLGGDKRCPSSLFQLKLLYDTGDPYYDFSISSVAQINQQNHADIYIPLYFVSGDLSPLGREVPSDVLGGYTVPFGIEVPNSHIACITSLEEVDTSHLYPVWITLFFSTEHWQQQILYQQFKF